MIGDKIKNLRLNKGLQQNILADQIEIDPSTLCKIENNQSHPSLKTLSKIAKALDVNIKELIDS